MESRFAIHSQHGTAPQIGVRVALLKAIESGLSHLGQFL
jgi:hypothetical protein